MLVHRQDADAVVAPVGHEDEPAGRVDGDAAAGVEHFGEGGRDRLDHLGELQALRVGTLGVDLPCMQKIQSHSSRYCI